MSLRTAGRQSPVLLAAVLLFGAWVGVNLFRVFDAIPSFWTGGGEVGQTWLGGLVGLLVMLVAVGLLITLYSALSESSPAPDTFPPREGGARTER
ncbi:MULTISPECIES: hypothetical protein [Halorussus]|uniref:hypothetical protein n=1 Tax=Halorussus TaxID=1070314 RepID=UPI0013B39977|nr:MULTISPECIES: hypothetical protein [Halorussus]NHN58702.1 hypothetical protein [Halorussus sp. JP-T4]